MSDSNIIGLDWEGVVTDFPPAMAALVSRYESCVIITQKQNLTSATAARWLQMDPAKIVVEICPDDRLRDYQQWKTDMCIKHSVALYLDDDPTIVMFCKQASIPVILVGRMPGYLKEIRFYVELSG